MTPTKSEETKVSGATLPVRLPKPLHADVVAMAEDTGIPTAQRVRNFLKAEVKVWKAAKAKKS